MGIATDNLNDIAPTYKKQTDYAKKNAIRYFIILDAELIKSGQVKLKDRQLEVEVALPLDKVAKTLRKIIRLNALKAEAEDGDVDDASIQAFAKLQL